MYRVVDLLGEVDGLLFVSSVLQLVKQLDGHFSSKRPRESVIIDALHQTHIERAVCPATHTISSCTHTQTHAVTSGVAVERSRDPAVVQFESSVEFVHPEHDGGDLNPALQPLHVLHGQLEVAVDFRFLVLVHLPSDQTHAAAEPVVGAVCLLQGAEEEVAVQLAQVANPDASLPRVVTLDGEGGDSVGSDNVVDWAQRLVAHLAVSHEVGRAPTAVDAPAITLRLAGVPSDHVARLAYHFRWRGEHKVFVVASNCHLN